VGLDLLHAVLSAPGEGLHSSTSQLNLTRVLTHSRHITNPITALKVSRKVDACKPLAPEQPLSPAGVQLAVRWALHAVSSAKVSTPQASEMSTEEHTESEATSANRLVVSLVGTDR